MPTVKVSNLQNVIQIIPTYLDVIGRSIQINGGSNIYFPTTDIDIFVIVQYCRSKINGSHIISHYIIIHINEFQVIPNHLAIQDKLIPIQ
jgi:hypothetical protein